MNERILQDNKGWYVLTEDFRDIEYRPQDGTFDSCARYLRAQRYNPQCPQCED